MVKIILRAFVFLFLVCGSVFAQSSRQRILETADYSIAFPGEYVKSVDTLSSDLGQLLLKGSTFVPDSIMGDKNFVYMLMETTYPDSTVHSDKKEILDEFFAGSIQGAVSNVNGKLIKEIRGTTGNYPNRTIEIEIQNGLAIIKMTMILRKNKMILIETITSANSYPNAAEADFMKSFVLK